MEGVAENTGITGGLRLYYYMSHFLCL